MDKTVCITGCDRGLGFELAKGLIKEGCFVFAGMHSKPEDLKILEKENPKQLKTVGLEVSNLQSIKEAAETIAGTAGKIDILINNAAILGNIGTTVFDKLDYEDMINTFNINALGALRTANAFIPLIMKSNEKLVVNISSEAGSLGTCTREGWYAYCMSKAALNMQSVILHNSIREKGGQVMIIHPGWMKTHIKGRLDVEAPLLPEESASSIIGLIKDHNRYKSIKPAFIDYTGAAMEW